MPVSEWFNEWVNRHVLLFGMDRDQDLATFLSWRELFIRAGYTFAELCEASDWLATHAPPQYRSEHLAALQERIRAARAEHRAREDAALVSYPDCPDCLGTGWVSVPDLRQVQDGTWHGYQTAAVLCRCGWGSR